MAIILTGCASQNANRLYFEADEALKKAMTKVGVNDPGASAAFDSLAKGKTEMMNAHYDLAIHLFRESAKQSREIIGGNPQTPPASLPPPAPPPVKPVQTPTIAETPKVVENSPPPPPAKPHVEVAAKKPNESKPEPKRSLPREALAKYLAGKRANSEKQKAAVVKEKASPDSPEKEKAPQNEVQKEMTQNQTASENVTIVAPAAPTIKPPPKPKDDPALTIEEGLTDSAEASTDKTGKSKNLAGIRRKIPGTIPFIVDDPSILTDAMTSLNQTGKFLLENPSTTIVLQGQLAPNEAKGLADARFESIKAYLVGKGVPEDQVQLDDERKRGKNPEFQMFVIEH